MPMMVFFQEETGFIFLDSGPEVARVLLKMVALRGLMVANVPDLAIRVAVHEGEV